MIEEGRIVDALCIHEHHADGQVRSGADGQVSNAVLLSTLNPNLLTTSNQKYAISAQ
jgi:hypothetical protein